MGQIARIARMAVYNRITGNDGTPGLNALVQTAAPSYPGVDPSLIVIEDWTLGGRNFLFGAVNPDAIDNSDSYAYPFCSIDTGTEANRNIVISVMFSGEVQVITYLHLSWENADILPNFAEYSDCASEAFFESVNSTSNILTGPGFSYSGRTTCQKSPIEMAGNGWRRSLSFSTAFTIITN